MARSKRRLDELLVIKGLFSTRTKAQASIMAGHVQVDGKLASKAGVPVADESQIVVLPDANPFVSRGGLKLVAALDFFPIEVRGRICLDIGASTGGFTDCLLSRGAAHVYAVDVGTAQLHAKLRCDKRVTSLEQMHAKNLEPGLFSPKPDLAVVDVSFISLTRVLPHILPCLAVPFEILALVKPQFELEPKLTPKGVVKKAEHRLLALERVRTALKVLPLEEQGILECPVHGPRGNIESFLYCRSTEDTGTMGPSRKKS
jgi:23S rRNA (cytidine1920-2'-O)/16S rRNA (cytidine1409-2'-O)-methyltransferase